MQIQLHKTKIIDYPSGSALEFYNDTLYVVGDDVHYILCLDAGWNEINRITLFDFEAKRIPKPDKPDLECATIIQDTLYVVGSGSKSPQRDVAFIIPLAEQKVKRISTAAFYALFRDRNLIAEMNIEGFTDCKDKLLFFNRANNTQPNQLIISDHKIIQKQFPNSFKVMPVQMPNLKGIPLGISGACYVETDDILLLTASAENTDNAYDDGAIVGSVLAIVRNAYQQLNQKIIDVQEVYLLDDIDARFLHQKIESICLIQNNQTTYTCVLVADNDDGKSVLFEISIPRTFTSL